MTATNLLVTGPPRSGKTTVIERVDARLTDLGLDVGGIYAPEVREDGERVGFRIVDAATDDDWELAHVGRESGPRIGKYRVNVAGVRAATERALSDPERFDALVVDEVAPMELASEAFVAGVERALASPTPVVAAVHQSSRGFVGDLKAREGTERFVVDTDTRDDLPRQIAERVLAALPD